MTEQSLSSPNTGAFPLPRLRLYVPLLLAFAAAVLVMAIGLHYRGLPQDAPLLLDSTPGELAVWMAGQSAEDAPPSLLGGWAKQWALQTGAASVDESALLTLMQTLVLVWCSVTALSIGAGIIGLLTNARWTRNMLVVGLFGSAILLFLIPTQDGDATVALILVTIVLLLGVLLVAPGRVTRFIGFMVAIATILMAWEVAKSLAAAINYQIATPQPEWTYSTYPSLEEALTALQTGDIEAVFADEKDLENFMPAYPEEETIATLPYGELRYLARFEQREQAFIFPIMPNMPGRLSVAVRADAANQYRRPSQFIGQSVAAVAGDFAQEKYLMLPRSLVLLDLQIFNDLNLPHLQNIAEAFLQPARRNGEFLLIRILGDAGLFTFREALQGFIFGVIFGLLLGTVFAHSRLMERALLPYVVASQTIPILAIAPMVVIWLGASPTAVAVIAAYITFFPVTINTLRGLQSPPPTAVELMESYAASRWTTLWKLRFPAALPYIFTALKVSATASVVGAIIGELPSGIGDGLGRAILDFSSDYSLISTPKLWAAIVMASFVGVIFFVAIGLLERLILRQYVRST
jgi:NitT/TauT family transport system permease protein